MATIQRVEFDPGSKPDLDKRTYLPYVVHDTCPNCKTERSKDLRDDYLSYPVPGEPEPVFFGCECGHEWTVKVVVDFTLRVA